MGIAKTFWNRSQRLKLVVSGQNWLQPLKTARNGLGIVKTAWDRLQRLKLVGDGHNWLEPAKTGWNSLEVVAKLRDC